MAAPRASFVALKIARILKYQIGQPWRLHRRNLGPRNGQHAGPRIARPVNSGNSWAQTTPLSFMKMPILTYITEISPRPILFIHGEKAHALYFAQTAYTAAGEPKELMIIPGASHTDRYDKVDVSHSTSCRASSTSISSNRPKHALRENASRGRFLPAGAYSRLGT